MSGADPAAHEGLRARGSAIGGFCATTGLGLDDVAVGYARRRALSSQLRIHDIDEPEFWSGRDHPSLLSMTIAGFRVSDQDSVPRAFGSPTLRY